MSETSGNIGNGTSQAVEGEVGLGEVGAKCRGIVWHTDEGIVSMPEDTNDLDDICMIRDVGELACFVA